MPPMQSSGRRGLTADGWAGMPLLFLEMIPQPRQLRHKNSPSQKNARCITRHVTREILVTRDGTL
eukprot:1207269-Pleurochrysis_carterae.AAC.1